MPLSPTEKKAIRFIGVFLAIYVVWIMLYQWVIQPWGWLDQQVINDNSRWSLFFLERFGYETFMGNHPTIRTIGIQGTNGLWIGDPCDGISLFALFSIFIIAYPGKWLHKIWFIPLGITIIHFLNILRICILCIVIIKHPGWLEFNHTYLFQIFMYAIVFLLWYIWIKRFSIVKTENK